MGRWQRDLRCVRPQLGGSFRLPEEATLHGRAIRIRDADFTDFSSKAIAEAVAFAQDDSDTAGYAGTLSSLIRSARFTSEQAHVDLVI